MSATRSSPATSPDDEDIAPQVRGSGLIFAANVFAALVELVGDVPQGVPEPSNVVGRGRLPVGLLLSHAAQVGGELAHRRGERVGLLVGLVVDDAAGLVHDVADSGLRFVRHAVKTGKPVVIVNRGWTRGDDLATHKVEAGTSEWLSAWAERTTASTRLEVRPA